MRRLAKESGLSQPMISYIERGMCNPTLDTLLRIAAALDVDLSKLLNEQSNQMDVYRCVRSHFVYRVCVGVD